MSIFVPGRNILRQQKKLHARECYVTSLRTVFFQIVLRTYIKIVLRMISTIRRTIFFTYTARYRRIFCMFVLFPTVDPDVMLFIADMINHAAAADRSADRSNIAVLGCDECPIYPASPRLSQQPLQKLCAVSFPSEFRGNCIADMTSGNTQSVCQKLPHLSHSDWLSVYIEPPDALGHFPALQSLSLRHLTPVLQASS